MADTFAIEKLGKTVTIRDEPRAAGAQVGAVPPYGKVAFVGIVPDTDHPGDLNYQWLDLGGGQFVNYYYPPAGQRFSILGGETGPGDQTMPAYLDVTGPTGLTVRYWKEQVP